MTNSCSGWSGFDSSTIVKIRIAQLGLGPIGLETLKLAVTKPWADVVGALEIDPARCRQDLADLTGAPQLRGRRAHASLDELVHAGQPDVVIQTSVSKFADAFAQIEPLVERGISVISSCEELVYPQLRQPKLASHLDALCRAHGARVSGAGVNPGFVMDLLPLCLTHVCCTVRAIHVERVVNASTRRGPLQKKIGSGLAPEHFRALLERGEAGHAGLRESLALIGHGLGWQLGELTEVAEVVVAERPIRTLHFVVKPGQVCGIHQRVETQAREGARLSLDIQMFLDAPKPHDTIHIEGEPPLHLVMSGGVAGDEATVGSLVNSVPRLLALPPGLQLLTDLPLPRMA
jgi:2,4-diaminopentanoate dehydrogenase